MQRISFNEGWEVRPKTNRFAEMVGGGAEWRAVTLPHDAVIGTERTPSATAATGFFAGGTWEYRKSFEVTTEEAGTAIVLEFEGVYRDATVYVNGSVAGQRPYGYSSFSIQVDHLLLFGMQNELRVEARAHDDSRWYSGAGIYRNVWLLRAGRLHLAAGGVRIATPEIDDEVAAVTVDAVVRNQSAGRAVADLRVELVDASGATVARGECPVTTLPGEALSARQRLYVEAPQRWGLDHPYLYSCRVSLLSDGEVVDDEHATFGIRSLALDPIRGLRVNAEPVLLRGACVHHDNGPLGAATIDRAEERRVMLLKEAGFNAIRSAHNPMSNAMLAACDRLGMIVMDEAFDVWTQSKSDDDYALRFARWWEQDIAAMVNKDFNHPSVVFYSIGNEIPEVGEPLGARRGRALADAVHALDGTRFVTQAISGLLVGGAELLAVLRGQMEADSGAEAGPDAGPDEETGVNTAMTDLASRLSTLMLSPVIAEKSAETASYLDVAGYNYMELRFEMDADQFPNRVIVASETHAPAIDSGWSGVLAHPHVIGDFTWTGWDYLGEAGIGRVDYGEPGKGMSGFLGEFPWLTAWCGDIDITGNRRPQSYYREIVFGLRRAPYLAVRRPLPPGQVVVHSSPWSWSDVVASWSWDGHSGEPMTVEVYAGDDEVELLLNRRSLGRRPAGVAHRFRAEFEVEFEPGVLEAVGWRDGEEIGRTSLRSAAGPVRLDARADRAEVRARPTDLAFVDLMLVDGEGTPCMSVARQITVELDGPGHLQGFGSADPLGYGRFTGTTCRSFEGRALAVIRPTGEGVITLTATAEGCEPGRVRIDARR